MPPKNCVTKLMYKIITYKDYFNNFMLLVTFLNILVMAVDHADGDAAY